jgi:hypothetical protein
MSDMERLDRDLAAAERMEQATCADQPPAASTDPADPDDPILDRAFAIWVRDGYDIEQAIRNSGVDASTDEQILAVAFSRLVDRCIKYGDAFDAIRKRIPDGETAGQRCGWCVKAAGRDDAAWQAAATMTFDEASAHALKCPHNPLVQEIGKLRARAVLTADRDRVLVAQMAATLAASPVYADTPNAKCVAEARALLAEVDRSSVAASPTMPVGCHGTAP